MRTVRPAAGAATPLLRVEDLSVTFGSGPRATRVVDGVSFDLDARGSLAIIGESGSGKTTAAQAVCGLLPGGDAHVAGRALFDGLDLLAAEPRQLEAVRGARIGFVFQDPLSSLNPVRTVGSQVAELFRTHRRMSGDEASRAAVAALARVHIPDPARRARDYPHQFSGGMRQRVMLAIALALDPALLIADEPTTALDVTVQAQIIDLVTELREQAATALVLISHDLGVAAALAERLAVMYGGRLVEVGALREVFRRPLHPYTRGLLAAGPQPGGGRLVPIPGAPPRPSDLPSGCSFHPRCAFAVERCRVEVPALREVRSGRFAACHLAESIPAAPASLEWPGSVGA